MRFVTMVSMVTTVTMSLGLSACGMMNATESMPPKMDSMNDAVGETNQSMDTMIGQVDETNRRMDELKDEVIKTNENMDDMIKEVRETNEGMAEMIEQVRKTNEGIEKTNDAVHNQALAVAMSEMMRPENTRSLVPPTGMLPAGQVFANEATDVEIVSLIYIYLQDINLTTPDESERDGNGKWKKDTIKRVDHEKLTKFMASMIIAGLAPAKTIEVMIATQIEAGGRHEDSAYAALMLRYMFIRDLQLQGSLLSGGLRNPGLVREAITLAEELQRISSLPYQELIRVKTTGMLDPEHNLEATLNADDTMDAWRAIDAAMEQDLAAKYRDPATPIGKEMEELRQKVRSHLQAAP